MGVLARIRRQDARPIASGTVARRDRGGGWVNDAGLGGMFDRGANTDYLPPMALDAATLDAIQRFNAIARRIVGREVDDAVRQGYTLKGIGEPVERAIIDAADGPPKPGKRAGLGVLQNVAKARKNARAYGGGAILIIADDGLDASQPLNLATLRRVRKLVTLDRHEITAVDYDMDPQSSGFGEPVMYAMTSHSTPVALVHASRVVRFQGLELPARTMLAEGGWGGSVIDLVWEDLVNYATTNKYTAEAVSLLTQGVLKSPSIADAIDAGDETRVTTRLEALRLGMGLLGDIALDSTEDYQVLARSLAGLKDAIDGATSALVAATDMPRSILLGESPGGPQHGRERG